MKKTFSAFLVLLLLFGVTGTALAASVNPFSDVPAGHWAYDAVAKLAKAGIVEGYGDDTYRGERTITRYEMAQMVAKAMAHSDKADAELKALIDKLSVEYADELERLGVRVGKLEEKTRIGWDFESRIRYVDNEYPGGSHEFYGTNRFDWRQRINLHGDVNDNVSFFARLETNNDREIGGETVKTGNIPFGSTANQSIGLNLAYFNIKNFLGAIDCLSVGRIDTKGVTNGLLNGKDYNNDGVKLVKAFGDTTFTAMITDQGTDDEIYLYNLDFKVGDSLKLNAGYQTANWGTDAKTFGMTSKSFDIGAQYKIGKVYLTGEYVNARTQETYNYGFYKKFPQETQTAWAIQLTNGVTGYLYPTYNLVDPRKPYSDAFAISYRKIQRTALYEGMSAFIDADFGEVDANSRGYFLTYQNVISKNIIWTAEYQELKFLEGHNSNKYWNTSFQFFF